MSAKQYFGKDLEAMSFAHNYHRWLLSEFSPYIKGSVAEVGAGAGNVSKLLLSFDIKKLTAFEPDLNMYLLLEEALRADNRAKAINDFFSKKEECEYFDSILYINVLEHINDDVSELTKVYAALAQEGHLLIFVPALPWLYSELDRKVGHYRRYTINNIVNLVKRTKFSIITVRYFDVVGIIPWFINFTLLKNTINGSNVCLYDRLVVPPMRVIEGLVPPPIGKNLLLIAKK